jgi:hypothetical protein
MHTYGELVAPRLCTASPAEVDRPSLHPGGTCLFSEQQKRMKRLKERNYRE